MLLKNIATLLSDDLMEYRLVREVEVITTVKHRSTKT